MRADSGHNPLDCRIAVEVSGGADVVEGLDVMPVVSQEDKKTPLMTSCASLKLTNVSRSSPISPSFVPAPPPLIIRDTTSTCAFHRITILDILY